MTARNVSSLPPRRAGVHDAYSAWFNAQQRSTEALRAWEAAPIRDRTAAYHIYVASVNVEEYCARELARASTLRRAA